MIVVVTMMMLVKGNKDDVGRGNKNDIGRGNKDDVGRRLKG